MKVRQRLSSQLHYSCYIQVHRSADLKVEAEVKINCSITSSAKYQWLLVNSDSQQQLNPSLYPQQRDAIFYLPPRSLAYGNYTLNLTVSDIYAVIPFIHLFLQPYPAYSVCQLA